MDGNCIFLFFNHQIHIQIIGSQLLYQNETRDPNKKWVIAISEHQFDTI